MTDVRLRPAVGNESLVLLAVAVAAILPVVRAATGIAARFARLALIA